MRLLSLLLFILFLTNEPFHRHIEDFRKYHEFIVRDKAVAGLNFADGLPLNGDAVDLHTGRKLRLGQSHGRPRLMDTVTGNIFLSIKVINLQGLTSNVP